MSLPHTTAESLLATDDLADLLNISTDPENCSACITADALWPRWPHGACPYHYGIAQALQLPASRREMGR